MSVERSSGSRNPKEDYIAPTVFAALNSVGASGARFLGHAAIIPAGHVALNSRVEALGEPAMRQHIAEQQADVASAAAAYQERQQDYREQS